MTFTKATAALSDWLGGRVAAALALALCGGWVAGLYDADRLVAVLSFLLMIALKRSQNCNDAAIHAKLDALVEHSEARNELIGVETREPDEIAAARKAEP